MWINVNFWKKKPVTPTAASEEISRMEKVVISYLKQETNYALLINGFRGIGKTFFAKNKIIPQIRSISRKHDASKFYKPIYISLYGVGSIDQVYHLLLFEFVPWLKHTEVKLGVGLARILTRGSFAYNRLGNMDEYFKDVSKTARETLETTDFVMIFDDLDRMTGNLTASEFIGFVNSLVEHDNNKVIIIADEKKVDDENYKAVKEKTIGTVIEYTTGPEITFDEIIALKYKPTFRSYFQYLQKLKTEILGAFTHTSTTNLRTLIYYLQHFDPIFHALHFELHLEKEEPGVLSIQKLSMLSRFTLAVAIEFKRGKITYIDRKEIDKVGEINTLLTNAWIREHFLKNMQRSNGIHEKSGPPGADPEKSFRELFVSNYFEGKDYQFYSSIYDFVTGGNELDVALLNKELKANFDDKQVEVTRQEEVYNQLSYPQVWDVDNPSLRALTAEMFKYALSGDYPLDRYQSIFHFLERFKEVLDYDPKDVAGQLIAAMEKHQQKFKYIGRLDSTFVTKEEFPNDHYFKDIFKAANRVNQKIKETDAQDKINSLFEKFLSDPDAFYIDAQSAYQEESVFNQWDFNSFHNQFKKMNATQIINLTRFVKNRYSYIQTKGWVEFDFLSTFLKVISQKEEGHEHNLHDYLLAELAALLEDILIRHQALLDHHIQ